MITKDFFSCADLFLGIYGEWTHSKNFFMISRILRCAVWNHVSANFLRHSGVSNREIIFIFLQLSNHEIWAFNFVFLPLAVSQFIREKKLFEKKSRKSLLNGRAFTRIDVVSNTFNHQLNVRVYEQHRVWAREASRVLFFFFFVHSFLLLISLSRCCCLILYLTL